MSFIGFPASEELFKISMEKPSRAEAEADSTTQALKEKCQKSELNAFYLSEPPPKVRSKGKKFNCFLFMSCTSIVLADLPD